MTNTPAKEPGRLIPWPYDVDSDVLAFGLSCVPDWVPPEYCEFFESYAAFGLDGADWFSPFYPPSDTCSVQSGYASMREVAEAFGADVDAWFPVADKFDTEYVAYHRKDDGSVEFGRYHFEDQEFLDGPYPSMTAWMRTYGVDL